MKRNILILSIVIVLILLTSGCYDNHEVDQFAYVVAVGLDKGKTEPLKMTLMFAVPVAIGAGAEGKGETGGEFLFTTIETPTIHAGINMVNTYIAKQINFSHTKAFIFSEEIAREGIKDYITTMTRSKEFRPNMFIAVSSEPAEKYLRSVTPVLEINPAKYFDMVFQEYNYTGFAPDSRLEFFSLKLGCTCSQAVAALIGVGKFKSSDEFKNIQGKPEGRYIMLEGDYLAGNMPYVFKNKVQVIGTAVFDGDKMVGKLNGQETLYYLLLIGKYKHSYISFPEKDKDNSFVVLSLKQSRHPKIRTIIEDGVPKVDVILRLEADIQSSIHDISDPQYLKELEKYLENYLKKDITRFLEKTARDFHSDICGVGRSLKKKFFYWDNWIKLNWLSKYKKSIFDVKVYLKIRRTGLTLKQEEVYGSGSEKQ